MSRPSSQIATRLVVAALALAAVVIALQRWSVERSALRSALPQRVGRIAVPGVSAPVSIVRDRRGVPHVRAETALDAWWALGFVHSQDRPAQMLWLRRLAQGRCAEVLGAEALPVDRFARTMGFAALAERDFAALDRESRSILEAYARGVNARFDAVRSGAEGPPIAMVGAPEDLQPWLPSDSVAVLKLISWQSHASLDVPLVLSDLIERVGGVGARAFTPADGQIQAIALPLELIPQPGESASPSGGGRSKGEPDPLTWFEVAALDASGWALPASLSEKGAPLLAAEVTTATTAPAPVYEALLLGGDLAVAGASLPGTPVFWAGRNQGVAWAIASAGAVAADLYQEKVGSSGRYHNGYRWTEFGEHTEVLQVAHASDGEAHESLSVRASQNGPLVDALLPPSRRGPDPERGALSVAWTGRQGDGFASLLALPRAANAEELVEILEPHRDPVVAVVFADREGRRGMQVAGWLPRRMLPTGLVPVPGRMSAFRWRDAIPFEALPGEFLEGDESLVGSGERRSWVRGADQPFTPESGSARIEWIWRNGIRSGRIDELVRELSPSAPVGAAELAEMLGDQQISSARAFVKALEALTAGEGDAGLRGGEIRRLLASWDGESSEASAAAAAYQVLTEELVRELFGPVLGDSLLDRYRALPRTDIAAIALEVVARAARDPDARGWAEPERVRRAVARSLERSAVILGFRLGPNRGRWSWGRLHQLSFTPLWPGMGEGAERALLGPWPVGGNATTLRRTIPASNDFRVARASTYQFVADLAVGLEEPEALWSSLAPGQSEHPRDRFYADRAEDWLASRLQPMLTGSALEEESDVQILDLIPE